MTCPHLTPEDLVAWTDGELPAADAERVAAHVASCPACAREADLLRRTGDLVAGMPRDPAPAGFGDRVVAAARAESAAPTKRAPRRGAGRILDLLVIRTWTHAAAAAAVLVVAAGGTLWLARLERGGGTAVPGALTAREEEAIAEDLYLLANLSALESVEAEELARIADDLDVLEAAADAGVNGEGG